MIYERCHKHLKINCCNYPLNNFSDPAYCTWKAIFRPTRSSLVPRFTGHCARKSWQCTPRKFICILLKGLRNIYVPFNLTVLCPLRITFQYVLQEAHNNDQPVALYLCHFFYSLPNTPGPCVWKQIFLPPLLNPEFNISSHCKGAATGPEVHKNGTNTPISYLQQVFHQFYNKVKSSWLASKQEENKAC